MVLLGILFCSLIFALHYYFTRTFNYWKKKNIKGPEPTALFGNFKDAALKRELLSVSMKKIYDNYRGEPFIGVYRMTRPWLMIMDLDLIKHIMIKDFEVFEERAVSITKKGLGANLFAADAETWRVLRHKFTPLFTTGKLKNMMRLITERSDKFLEYVDTVTSKQPEQEVHELVQLYTISTIAACAFGLDVDVTDESNSFLKALHKINNLIFSKRFVQDLLVMYPNILKTINISPVSRQLDYFFNNLVATILKERNGVPTDRNDFMDLILELKNKGNVSGPKTSEESKEFSLEITKDIIAAQAFIFYAAGYETSATTMSFLLYEIAMNLHIQEKLIHEIDEVLSKCNGKITYESLGQLSYMEKVFDETLRKYPLADPLQRKAKRDYKIPGTDIIIEKGQTVVVPVMAIHHNEKLYPNPEVFDPERFDPKVSAERHSCAYLPFGTGPRNCIGMRFAKVQSRACILYLLSRYRIEPLDTKEMTFDRTKILIRPHKDFKLKFIARNKKTTQETTDG